MAADTHTGETGTPTSPTPVCLRRTEQWIHRSRGNGREYLIYLSTPAESPPPDGFPIIYLLDGNATFGTVVESIALRSRRPDVTGVVPAVVVGIGYETADPYDRVKRTYDYTPFPPEISESADRSGGEGETGGAELFLDFLEAELKPFVEARVPVDRSHQALVGHSLGGLLVLHTLTSRPSSFQSYVASSPSIWWARERLLEEISNLAAKQTLVTATLRVMLTVGEHEQKLGPQEVGSSEFRAKGERRSQRRMVDDAREAANRLEPLARSGGRVHFEVFPGEDHASTALLTVNQFLRFVLGR
jgi:predicted alpha/beta superfamily hydrolase